MSPASIPLGRIVHTMTLGLSEPLPFPYLSIRLVCQILSYNYFEPVHHVLILLRPHWPVWNDFSPGILSLTVIIVSNACISPSPCLFCSRHIQIRKQFGVVLLGESLADSTLLIPPQYPCFCLKNHLDSEIMTVRAVKQAQVVCVVGLQVTSVTATAWRTRNTRPLESLDADLFSTFHYTTALHNACCCIFDAYAVRRP